MIKTPLGIIIKPPDPLAAFQDARDVDHHDFGDRATNEPTVEGTASALLTWVARTAGMPVSSP